MTDEPPLSRRDALAAEPTQPRRTAESAEPGRRGGGIAELLRKNPRALLISALALAFVLLGTGAVFAGVAYGSTPAAAPQVTETPLPPRPQPSGEPTSAILRTCSVTKLAKDKRFPKLAAAVIDADSGELLWSSRPSSKSRTGSVLKVFTASAAVLELGADYQLSTTVVTGSQPGSIVLVGHGDATLSAMPPGTESIYTGAPKLSTLAASTLAKFSQAKPGEQITSLVLDASYWSTSDKWDPTWKRSEQTIGYHSEVTALQVDGDRADPTRLTSPRSTDPIGRAGKAFLQALRDADGSNIVADDVKITTGTAAGGTKLAEVKSQPVRVLIKQMLLNSDNTLAEMLARVVSKSEGLGGSAASLQQAIPSALFPDDPETASQVKIKDGSGLSDKNGVPAPVMARFLIRVESGTDNLDLVRDALPVAGKSGTLASRFTGDNAVLRGNLTAKTGWIDTAYTLAGFLTAKDGTKLTFAFFAVGDGIKDSAKEALDTLATGVYKCGSNLANF